MCMLANTGDGQSHQNKSLIIVPLREGGKRMRGVSVGKKLRKMGMHSSDTALLYFEDVRVPARNLIGEEGRGFVYQMMQFQEERLYAAVKSAVGCERMIETTIDYTRQRHTFGKPILHNQVVHFRLAGTRHRNGGAARADVEGDWNARGRRDCTKLASMAKLKGGRRAA